jgi:hypothetical protein
MIISIVGIVCFVAGYLFHKFLAQRLAKTLADGAENLAGRV